MSDSPHRRLRQAVTASSVDDIITAVTEIAAQASELDRLLPIAAVKLASGLTQSSIYRRMAAGTFPRPQDLGGAVRWRASAIKAWQDGLPEAVGAEIQSEAA
jgi:prophage regulatory protein